MQGPFIRNTNTRNNDLQRSTLTEILFWTPGQGHFNERYLEGDTMLEGHLDEDILQRRQLEVTLLGDTWTRTLYRVDTWTE